MGYFFSLSNTRLLNIVSKTTSYLVYVILFLMGLNLSALDDLGANMQTILSLTATFFIVLACCNLLVLPVIDKIFCLTTEQSHHSVPLIKMAFESMRLIMVVGSGLLLGLFIISSPDWSTMARQRW